MFGPVPNSLETAYREAFDERRLVKRELKALAPLEDLPDERREVEVRPKIGKLQDELSSAYERLGQRKGILSFEKRRIEGEIEKIRSTLVELKFHIKGFKQGTEKSKFSRFEKQREQIVQEIGSLNKELSSCREQLNKVRVEREAEEKLIKRLQQFNGTCPMPDGQACLPRCGGRQGRSPSD